MVALQAREQMFYVLDKTTELLDMLETENIGGYEEDFRELRHAMSGLLESREIRRHGLRQLPARSPLHLSASRASQRHEMPGLYAQINYS